MMLFQWFKQNKPLKYSNRRYISTLFSSTALYAPFPTGPVVVRLGDFGKIDATGKFMRRGNLATIDRLSDDLRRDIEYYLREQDPVEEEARTYSFFSDTHTAAENMVSLAEITELTDFTIKGGWEYSKEQLVSLVLIRPQIVDMQFPGVMKDLLWRIADETGEDMRQYAVVIQVVYCDAYANVVTSKKSGRAYYGFDATVGPELVGGPRIRTRAQWHLHTNSGAWGSGAWKLDHRYISLINLVTIGEQVPDIPVVSLGPREKAATLLQRAKQVGEESAHVHMNVKA